MKFLTWKSSQSRSSCTKEAHVLNFVCLSLNWKLFIVHQDIHCWCESVKKLTDIYNCCFFKYLLVFMLFFLLVFMLYLLFFMLVMLVYILRSPGLFSHLTCGTCSRSMKQIWSSNNWNKPLTNNWLRQSRRLRLWMKLCQIKGAAMNRCPPCVWNVSETNASSSTVEESFQGEPWNINKTVRVHDLPIS